VQRLLYRTLLRQWVETVQWLVPAGLLRLRPKLVLMHRRPFGYESYGPCWQLARDDPKPSMAILASASAYSA